jgi:hypothetical protein
MHAPPMSTSLATGGGEVVLAWTESGATALSIDNGVGSVLGATSVSVAITQTTTFTLTATNDGGTTTAQVTVNVAVPSAPPVINAFAASTSTLPAYGGTITLSWSVDGASALALDNGVGDVTGSAQTDVVVTVTTTFTLTATNASGQATSATTVTVTVPTEAPTILTFSVAPATVNYGSNVIAAWSQRDAQTLTLITPTGTIDVTRTTNYAQAATVSGTYTLRATNLHGMTEANATIEVIPPPPPVIESFSSNPSVLDAPGYVVLAWSVRDYDTIVVDGYGDATALNGALQRYVSATRTFTLRATNAGGTVQNTITVTVND